MLAATGIKLKATEIARIEKFTASMDTDTTEAMFNLFKVTESCKNEIANALIAAAHQVEATLSDLAIAYLKPLGLVQENGTIPKTIKDAIQKAVTRGFLVVGGPENPHLKPSPNFLEPHYE